MKKGILKVTLISSLLSMVASPLLAEEMAMPMETKAPAYKLKMGLNLRTYFGQINSGVEGTSGYMTEVNEGNISGKITSGAVTGYMEVESRAGSATPTTIRNVVYAMPSGLSFGLGTFKQKSSVNFSALAGTGTAATGAANFYVGLTNKLEGEGMKLNYKAGDHKLDFVIYEDDRINKVEGSTTQVGAMGKFGPIKYRVASTSASTDDHTGGTAVASSASNFGAKYDAGAFSVSVDSATKSKGTGAVAADADAGTSATKAYNKVYTDTALQIGAKIGANKLIVTLATETNAKDTTNADKTTTSHTDLVYSIPLEKNASFKVAYASKASSTATYDTTDTETTTTATFAGVGLVVKF